MSKLDRADDFGFSLFELLVAVLLILIAAAFAIPLFSSTGSFNRLRSASFAIAGRLNEAKIRSISELTPHQILFEAFPSKNWQVGRRADRTNPSSGLTTVFQSGLGIGIQYRFPPGTGVNSASNEDQCGGRGAVCAPQQSAVIAFNSRGIPINPSTGAPNPQNAIYLTNGKDHFAVTVSLAGAVQVWQHVNDAWVPQRGF